jgi:iron(III) transport system ATP-binding protein
MFKSRSRAAATFAASLKLDAVSRHYGDAEALTSVDLTVAPGEIVSLLGPSGCGKTTLLRIISGIERPTSGRVLINDRVVAGNGIFEPPERRSVGLVFQDFALFPHLSVLDNVAFGLKALAAADRKRAAMAILDRVGLSDFANAFPSTLSGGQQQRVALARAIVPRPAMMLMDEPFSGLDVQLRDAMQEEALTLLRETRATSIIVTHHPEEAMRLSNRIAVMSAGRIVQLGTSEELYRKPASLFVARLFSDVNEISVQVAGGQIVTPAGRFGAQGQPDGAPAVLCVREAAIHLTPARLPPADAAQSAVLGRVLAARFLGDAARLDVAVQGFDKPLKVRTASDKGYAAGSEVSVAIDPAGVLVFPQETAAGANR